MPARERRERADAPDVGQRPRALGVRRLGDGRRARGVRGRGVTVHHGQSRGAPAQFERRVMSQIAFTAASTDWGVARRLPLLARSVLGLGTRVSLHPRIFEDSQDRLRQVKPTPVPSGDLREQAQFLQPCDGLPRSWI